MAGHQKRFRWAFFLAVFATQLMLWMLLVAKLDLIEFLVAIPAAVFAAFAATAFDVLGLVHFRPGLRDLLQIWRLPGYLFSDTWAIFQGMIIQVFTRKGAPSVLAATPFDTTHRHATARAVLVVTYSTITPNFVVLGIIPEQHLLLYHQILPGKVITMTRNLGAQP